MIFDTKLPIKLQFLQDSAKFFSFKRSGNPFKGRKTLAALLDFAAKNIGQRNAFLGRGDDLPNDGSLPTADDALGEGFPAATRGFAPSVSGGIIYTVADCQSSKD